MNSFATAWNESRKGTDSVATALPGLSSPSAVRTAKLYDEFQASLLRYLASLTQHSTEAEDLVQEAFLRLYRDLEEGKSIREPRAWLFAVAHNLAMDYHRTRLDTTGASELLTLRDPRGDAEADLIAHERTCWLNNALYSLSPQQRSCLELRAEGLRYREIAEILGVQISTVRTFIVRAVTRLAGGPK